MIRIINGEIIIVMNEWIILLNDICFKDKYEIEILFDFWGFQQGVSMEDEKQLTPHKTI